MEVCHQHCHVTCDSMNFETTDLATHNWSCQSETNKQIVYMSLSSFLTLESPIVNFAMETVGFGLCWAHGTRAVLKDKLTSQTWRAFAALLDCSAPAIIIGKFAYVPSTIRMTVWSCVDFGCGRPRAPIDSHRVHSSSTPVSFLHNRVQWRKTNSTTP